VLSVHARPGGSGINDLSYSVAQGVLAVLCCVVWCQYNNDIWYMVCLHLNNLVNFISCVTNNMYNRIYISIETAINAWCAWYVVCNSKGWDRYSHSFHNIRYPVGGCNHNVKAPSKAGRKAGMAAAISACRNRREEWDDDDEAQHSTVQHRCSRSCSILLFLGAWVIGMGGGIWDGRPLVLGQTANNLSFRPPPKWQLQSAKF
jgi:hypothetical protein